MWCFFIVLFGGGYYLLKYLSENASHAAIDRDWEMNEEKFKGLISKWQDSYALVREVKKKWPWDLEELFEPIEDDLYDIFGDIDVVEYFKHHRLLFEKWIPLLLESKNGNLPDSAWYIETEVFGGLENFEEFKKWIDIHDNDTWSYKKYISLRFCKKIEENIKKKYPDFKFVFAKKGEYKYEHEHREIHQFHRVGLNNYHKYRRLWDDSPLTAESAPKYNYDPTK